jgi:hypothetical protein
VRHGLPQSLFRQWRKVGKSAFRSLGVTLRGDAQPPFLSIGLVSTDHGASPFSIHHLISGIRHFRTPNQQCSPILEEHLAISEK